jgi:hypothetical protein
MKNCVVAMSLAGLLCVLMPAAAHAGVPQWRQTRTATAAQAQPTIRKSPKPPRHDQVQRRNLEGSITLIQIISTRRPPDERHDDRIVPLDSAAQVRASWDDAEREPMARLTARPVESLPQHWGATHLCI